jgi:hypothetical protein
MFYHATGQLKRLTMAHSRLLPRSVYRRGVSGAVFKIAAVLVAAVSLGELNCSDDDVSVSTPFAPGQVPDHCSGDVYFVIAAATCSCTGDVAYALCQGDSYLECSCTVPCGFASACPTKNGLSVFCDAGLVGGIPVITGDAACVPDGEQ